MTKTLKFQVDILTNIRHPNLVSYIGEYEKKYALICEHLPDGTLQDRLVNKRQTSWEERIRISASICSTLLFLHNMKPSPVIHGDLEAQNISFDADNVCKLSVFGMSYSTQHTTTTTNNNNNIVPSIQSDISAFGIVLLQIVTGQAEMDLVRKEVLKMGDLNLFQEKDIGWQREVLKNKKIVDDKLENWPTEDAVKMLVLGLRCSHPEENERPDLATEVWTQISSMKRGASESQGRPGGLFGR
jgi:serine/threonine protein kinase